jgi:hypothetical protein
VPRSNLRKLSDETLLSRPSALVRREHNSTFAILHHLNEVERRKLHLQLGYPSLFRYCTDRLGYSESSAGRRIQTARIIRRYPQVIGLLEQNEVNITTVSRVAGVVFERDDPSLVGLIRGKTQREVDAIVARYRPAERARDRVRPVRVMRAHERDGDGRSLP